MKNRNKINYILLSMFFFIALIGLGYAKEKAIAAKEITATYIKSEIGDYNHGFF